MSSIKGRPPAELTNFCRDTPVRISNFGYGPGAMSYTYGLVSMKDDKERKLYWINIMGKGIVRIHEDHLQVASKLDRLLYF